MVSGKKEIFEGLSPIVAKTIKQISGFLLLYYFITCFIHGMFLIVL